MTKIYIAGKVTGLDRKEVIAKFERAAKFIKALGGIPVNPVEFVPEDATWDNAIRECLIMLKTCQGVLFLSDWQDSKGARIEHSAALNKGMMMFYEEKLTKIFNDESKH